MTTCEIRPADGGADAEQFATELTSALSRALIRDGHNSTISGTVLTLENPHWL